MLLLNVLLLFSLVSVAITGNCLPVLAGVSLQASRRTDNHSSPFLKCLCPLRFPVTVSWTCHGDAVTDAYSSRPLLWRCQMQKVQNGGCCRDQLACCPCYLARQLASELSRQARARYCLHLAEWVTSNVYMSLIAVFYSRSIAVYTLCLFDRLSPEWKHFPQYKTFLKGRAN